MTLADIAKRISLLIKDRDYISVAHGTGEDIKVLNNIDPGIMNRACYVLDTVKAAQFPLQLCYRYSMEKLLDDFGISYAKLHVAGNDAHFALKALLMIAVRDGRRTLEITPPDYEQLFCVLDAIAHAPCDLPVWSDEPPLTSSPPKTRTSIGAKRRLRLERRATKQATAHELVCNDESTKQQSKDEHQT